MKNIILVDSENVGIEAFQGIEHLKGSNTQIVFFVSTNSKPISPMLLYELQRNDILLLWEPIEDTIKEKNNMDFHLICYLALDAKKNSKNDVYYYILSRDLGFINPAKYLANKLSLSIENISVIDNIFSSDTTSNKNRELDNIIQECKLISKAPVEFHRQLQLHLNSILSTNEIADIYWQHKQDFIEHYLFTAI